MLKLAACLLASTGLLLIGLAVWIPAKAQLAQILLERAWRESKETQSPIKPWHWADTAPVARLSIPSLQLDTIVLKEAGGEGLAFGPVHLIQSAKLGTQGTSVVAAHRDTHFQKLADLELNDTLIIEPIDGPSRTYRVNKMRVAPWDESGLVRDTGETRLVLTSCWPFDSLKPGPLRFIAEAELIDTEQPQPL